MTEEKQAEGVKPVAWLYEHHEFGRSVFTTRWDQDTGGTSDDWIGWTETPLYAQPASQPVGDVETGWLIELPFTASGGGRLCWVALADAPFPRFRTLNHSEDYDFQRADSPLLFTPDHNASLRFARKVDAEAFIRTMDKYLLHAVATEHQWINSAALSQHPDPQPEEKP